MSTESGLQANALLFVTDLATNSTMREAWLELLQKGQDAASQAKSQGESEDNIVKVYEQVMQVADNFLADHGYDTTAKIVLDLLKSPLYEDYVKETSPNDDSDRFVQTLLTNTKIFTAWQQLVQQVGAGSKQTTDLDQFLKTNRYDCSYMQVNASFVKMRNHNMNYWAGSYTTVQTKDGDSTSDTGPIVAILGDNKISVNHDQPSKLFNHLQYNNGQLTWKAFLPIKYSGEITFSEITAPTKEDPYVGPIFIGTLTWNEDDPLEGRHKGDVYTIEGRLSSLSHDDVIKNLPASVSPSVLDEILQWVNYALLGIFILKTVAAMGKKYLNVKDFESDTGAFKDRLDNAVEKAEIEGRDIDEAARSPFSEMNFKGSNMLKDIQEKMDSATGEEKQNLEQQYKDQKISEKDFDTKPWEDANPEGESWAGDLDKVASGML